jgi:uracil-DNA glycosylase
MAIDSLPVHSSWAPTLEPHKDSISRILKSLEGKSLAPKVQEIFNALELPLSDVKCVIVGQDPYPTEGNAHGLAFSVSRNVQRIPASLQNIFKELEMDLGFPAPSHGYLVSWQKQGVLLLNRVLTTEVGVTNAHKRLGWQEITSAIAQAAADQGAVALLWGKQAEELAPLFKDSVISAHPSPLSAYRGFFGSRPFSKVNEKLINLGREPIDWRL